MKDIKDMKDMKYKVIKEFNDIYLNIIRNKGEIIDITEERAKEINEKKTYVELVKDNKEKEEKKLRSSFLLCKED
jgi:hypothetical protein|nr:MAG TPA: hypothetical protein [Caudoviricetes sp.]